MEAQNSPGMFGRTHHLAAARTPKRTTPPTKTTPKRTTPPTTKTTLKRTTPPI